MPNSPCALRTLTTLHLEALLYSCKAYSFCRFHHRGVVEAVVTAGVQLQVQYSIAAQAPFRAVGKQPQPKLVVLDPRARAPPALLHIEAESPNP